MSLFCSSYTRVEHFIYIKYHDITSYQNLFITILNDALASSKICLRVICYGHIIMFCCSLRELKENNSFEILFVSFVKFWPLLQML